MASAQPCMDEKRQLRTIFLLERGFVKTIINVITDAVVFYSIYRLMLLWLFMV